MNRADFQHLAHLRLAEAHALLAAGHPAGAYYLAGYAVECALKACIAKSFQQHEFPDKNKVANSYSHDLEKLLKIAGLAIVWQEAIEKNKEFKDNWLFVENHWSEEERYNGNISTPQAQRMVDAVGDPDTGVLAWLIQHW